MPIIPILGYILRHVYFSPFLEPPSRPYGLSLAITILYLLFVKKKIITQWPFLKTITLPIHLTLIFRWDVSPLVHTPYMLSCTLHLSNLFSVSAVLSLSISHMHESTNEAWVRVQDNTNTNNTANLQKRGYDAVRMNQ